MAEQVFISTAELSTLMDSNSVQIIDSGMGGKAEHFNHRIAGSKYFNIPEIRNKTSPLSQEVPTAAEFSEYAQRLGVKNDGRVLVVYDQSGATFAGRGWFLFRHFGYPNVRILDGGLVKWLAEGRPTVSGEYDVMGNSEGDAAEYSTAEAQGQRAYFPEVLQISQKIGRGETDVRIWDPRPAEMFNQGTVENASNLPFPALFNADKTVKSREEVLKMVNERIGTGEVITSCFKGNIASLAYALLIYAGKTHSRLYSGSLEEWKTLKV